MSFYHLQAGSFVCFMDHIVLNHQVLIDEFCSIGVVGMDGTNFRWGEDNVINLLVFVEITNGLLVCEI